MERKRDYNFGLRELSRIFVLDNGDETDFLEKDGKVLIGISKLLKRKDGPRINVSDIRRQVEFIGMLNSVLTEFGGTSNDYIIGGDGKRIFVDWRIALFYAQRNSWKLYMRCLHNLIDVVRDRGKF